MWNKLPFFKALIWISTTLWLFSCMDDDALWETLEPGHPGALRGVFIVNEGNFMYGNASLSFYDPEEKEIFNDVFFNTNGLPLGDVAHSMTIRENRGYVVVNNSGRIYVIDTETFALKGKITGLTSPRHIHFLSDEKAYVSDLYGQSITIVNPETLEITGSINVSNSDSDFYQHSTEQMVQYGKYVFVNCWSFDHHILVIDTETDEWVDAIEVIRQPQSMVMDRHDKLWVLADGGFPGSPHGQEEPGLIRIDAASRKVEKTFRFAIEDLPLSLAINGTRDTLYFINEHVYRHPVAAESAPELFFESPYSAQHAGGFRALGVDPVSSEVYLGDAIDHVQPGVVYRLSPQALPLDTLRTGILPGSFAFE